MKLGIKPEWQLPLVSLVLVFVLSIFGLFTFGVAQLTNVIIVAFVTTLVALLITMLTPAKENIKQIFFVVLAVSFLAPIVTMILGWLPI